MENIKISILTATYNRGVLLGRLYDSIVENLLPTVKIEWLIMDDGSTDNTKEVVNKLEEKNNLEIKYNYQQNSGKMKALNNLVQIAQGQLIIECDSDDYIANDAVKKILDAYEESKNEKDIYALCFLKTYTNGENIGKTFKNKKTNMFDLYFKEGEDGEKALVFIADIRKKYKYKLEKNEKFITEARMYHEMDLKYYLKCYNEPIMVCEYQEDGYTKNIKEQFKKYPYGYYEYFKEILERDMRGVNFTKRIYAIKHYILFSYLTKQYNSKIIKGGLNKILYHLLFKIGILKSRKMFS